MRVIWYDSIDSTNAEAMRRAEELENLTVIAAREQTAGRGQRGNTWSSAPGENLTFTVLLKGNFTSEDLVRLNMAAAVAVRNFLRAEGVEAVIKWPNDIYVGKRKICGMLIENRLGPSGSSVSAVGIGINLNQTEFPASLPNPTSLKLLTGRTTSPELALERFIPLFGGTISAVPGTAPVIPGLTRNLSPSTPDNLLSDYCSALFQKDVERPYRDLRTGEVFRGIIRGVSPADGRLIVERSVTIVPQNGTMGAKMGENDLIVPSDGTMVTPYGFKDIGYIL